jgi:hypothetical protein
LFDEPKDMAALASTCKVLNAEVRAIPLRVFLYRSVDVRLNDPVHVVVLNAKKCIRILDDQSNVDNSWMQPGGTIYDVVPASQNCVFDVDEITDAKYDSAYNGGCMPSFHISPLEDLEGAEMHNLYGTPGAANMTYGTIYNTVYDDIERLHESFEYDGLADGVPIDIPIFRSAARTVCGSGIRGYAGFTNNTFCVTVKPILFGPTIYIRYAHVNQTYTLDDVIVEEGLHEDDAEDFDGRSIVVPTPVGMDEALPLETKVDVVVDYFKTHVCSGNAQKADYVGALVKKATTPENMLQLIMYFADITYDKTKTAACIRVARIDAAGRTVCSIV